MADKTHIEWADATWNPVTGCSVVSPGCKHCYAMRLAGTRLKHHPSRKGLTVDTKEGPVWNGEVRFNESWLDQPLHWKAPRLVFVCAHGDLFHDNVPEEWIDKIFAVMALAPQHIFQVLTKRAERMQCYLGGYGTAQGRIWFQSLQQRNRIGVKTAANSVNIWPLPNVWIGVSVEDQARADERLPALLATPAALRWVSAEPLLWPVDLTAYPALDWVVAGGESGAGARPMHPDWVRSLRDQCAAAAVPFFFKQWGGRTPKAGGRVLDGRTHDDFPASVERTADEK